MKYKILFAIIFIISNVFFIKAAKSQTNEICTFTTTNPGDLVRIGQPRATKFVTSQDAGGTPVQMDITCKEPARLTVSAPIQVGGPEFTPVLSETTVTTAAGATTKTGDAPLLLPAGTTSVTVNMLIDRGQRLRAGNYRFTFKLDFAAQ